MLDGSAAETPDGRFHTSIELGGVPPCPIVARAWGARAEAALISLKRTEDFAMCFCGYRRARRDEEPEVHETASRALDILKERFAKGEIDKAEFEERRTLILQ